MGVKIEILRDGQVVDTHELNEGVWKIGRAPECHIQLKSPQVSKQHATLYVKGNRAAIVDAGSSNGIFVNGILVKKHRIDSSDEVNIAEFTVRLARLTKRPVVTSGTGAFAGNAAMELEDPAIAPQNVEGPSPELAPQERLLQLVDEKILRPLYSVMETSDWRFVMVTILMLALVASVLLSVVPVVRWAKNATTQEALARAQTVVSQAVRENFRVLSKTEDFSRLTLEMVEAEKGILTAYIIDPKNLSILAPAKLYNESVVDPYAKDAIDKIIRDKQDQVTVSKDDKIWVVAQPIYLFSNETNERTIRAVVLAMFEIPASITSTFVPMVEASLFALVLSLGAFFLIYKMVTYPIGRMSEQLDAALKGESVTIAPNAKLLELEQLATAINFALSRVREGGGGGVGAPVGGGMEGDEGEAEKILEVVKNFDMTSGDALLVLDQEKRVRYVGRVLEELVGLRNQYAQGQNIGDAARDAAFAGTVIDLSERVIQSIGALQQATFEVNGTQREIAAVGYRGAGGSVILVLLTIRMTSTER